MWSIRVAGLSGKDTVYGAAVLEQQAAWKLMQCPSSTAWVLLEMLHQTSSCMKQGRGAVLHICSAAA